MTKPRSAAPAKSAPSPKPGRVVLASTCTIHEAPAIKAHMLDQLTRPAPYEIDGTSVERIDTAGVQLLLAFALDCMDRNLGFFWKGRSAPLDEAIALMGVATLLESPGVSIVPGVG